VTLNYIITRVTLVSVTFAILVGFIVPLVALMTSLPVVANSDVRL
jgi:hypothetical protein